MICEAKKSYNENEMSLPILSCQSWKIRKKLDRKPFKEKTLTQYLLLKKSNEGTWFSM
jgi:hypothetical protein